MKRILTLIAVVALLAVSASYAQMNGGGMHGRGSQPGAAGSGMQGPGNGMNGNMSGMGRQLLVAPDGTAFLMRVAASSTTTIPATFEVVAVRSTGAIAWTATLGGGMAGLTLSGNLLIASDAPFGAGMSWNNGATNIPTKSQLKGISIVSGALQWTTELDGIVIGLEPFAGGTYVTVIKPSQVSGGGMNGPGGTMGTMNGSRTLLAVGPNGDVLWRFSIN